MSDEQRLNVTAVAVAGRGIVIEGEPGSGKTSLALALIDRGAVLIGDDAVTLGRRGNSVLVSPPASHIGRIEIRGIGLVDMRTASAPLALVLRIDRQAPRTPEADRCDVLGCKVPLLAFRVGDPLQALRAEYALEQFGIA